MDLAEVHEELVFDLHEGVAIVAGDAPLSELGDTFDGLTDRFEALGICHLLELADRAQYRVNLVRAGQARRFFLRRVRREEALSDRHLGLSRTRALLASIAGGSLTTALEIVNLSIEEYHADWEYEDDYAYYLALHRFLAQRDAPLEPILERFERALEGDRSPRLDLLRALRARDRAAYLGALGDLLEEEGDKIDADRDSAAVHEGDVLFWPRSYLSIEGLALLQIGELAGLAVTRAKDTALLPRCPAIARIPLDDRVFEDLLEQIERAG